MDFAKPFSLKKKMLFFSLILYYIFSFSLVKLHYEMSLLKYVKLSSEMLPSLERMSHPDFRSVSLRRGVTF